MARINTLRQKARQLIYLGSSTLFGRTFLLLSLLMMVSISMWFQTFLLFEREPRAHRISLQMVSVVNLIRISLYNMPDTAEGPFLKEIDEREGVQILARHEQDVLEPLAGSYISRAASDALKNRLGSGTEVYGAINGIPGIWVSLTLEEGRFWVGFPRESLDRVPALEWIGWGAIALIISIIGSGIITALVVRPIRQLTQAVGEMREGTYPAPLVESGPQEIASLNKAFNSMAQDLKETEEHRLLMLAGISHDLRTPLARLRLEVEMGVSDPSIQHGMVEDIEQMDLVVGQFLEMAKPWNSPNIESAPVQEWLNSTLAVYNKVDKSVSGVDLSVLCEEPEKHIVAPLVDLSRVVMNLVENSKKYGRHPNEAFSRVQVQARCHKDHWTIDVRDHGPGVPVHKLDFIKRPFARLDHSRANATGAGIGLAVCDRLLRRVGAELKLSNAPDGGLVARIHLPHELVFNTKA